MAFWHAGSNTRWSGPRVDKVPGSASAGKILRSPRLVGVVLRPLNLSC